MTRGVAVAQIFVQGFVSANLGADVAVQIVLRLL